MNNPRMYRETTIKPEAGGGKVRLKHRELFLSSSMKQATEDIVTDSRYRIITALAKTQSARTPAVDQEIDRHFKTGVPVPADAINRILTVLELIRGGIVADVNIKVSNYNYAKFNDPRETARTTEGYIATYRSDGHKGDIHVWPQYIKSNAWQAARVFIHEASHKYADTKDFGEQGYRYANDSDFRQPGISPADCLDNADSYAYYVMSIT